MRISHEKTLNTHPPHSEPWVSENSVSYSDNSYQIICDPEESNGFGGMRIQLHRDDIKSIRWSADVQYVYVVFRTTAYSSASSYNPVLKFTIKNDTVTEVEELRDFCGEW